MHVSVFKESTETPLGILLAKCAGKPPLIKQVVPRGLGEKAGLLVGDALISVNGEEAFNDVVASQMVKKSEGHIVLSIRRVPAQQAPHRRFGRRRAKSREGSVGGGGKGDRMVPLASIPDGQMAAQEASSPQARLERGEEEESASESSATTLTTMAGMLESMEAEGPLVTASLQEQVRTGGV